MGWQVGFVQRLELEEACRLLNEVPAWLPQPIVADGCTCSGVLAQPGNPTENPRMWTSQGRSAPAPLRLISAKPTMQPAAAHRMVRIVWQLGKARASLVGVAAKARSVQPVLAGVPLAPRRVGLEQRDQVEEGALLRLGQAVHPAPFGLVQTG